MVTKEKLEGINSGSLSAGENVEKCIQNIEQKEPAIKAIIDYFPEEARKRAKEIDEKIKSGEKPGRLAGLTVAVKNNTCIEGKRATCSSKVLENYTAPYTATAVRKILSEGAIIIATTNMDEFACGSDNTKSSFYPTRNPLDTDYVPGGSSGGSAASVAAGMSDLAIGSDTGGSVRCPASFCGVVGGKSTYGTVSRYGLIDMGMSLDQIGPVSPDIYGAHLLLSVISGEDENDTACNKKLELSEIDRDISKYKIAILKEFMEESNDAVERISKDSFKKLEKQGAEIIEASIPTASMSVPLYYLQMCAEFSSAMQKFDGFKYGHPANTNLDLVSSVSNARSESFGPEVKRRVLLGTYITMREFRDQWFTKTLKARRLLTREFQNVFKDADLIAGPTMPCLPWKIGARSSPVEMYRADVLTSSANLAGLPAFSFPCGNEGKFSIGLQLHANYLNEQKIFNAGSHLIWVDPSPQ